MHDNLSPTMLGAAVAVRIHGLAKAYAADPVLQGIELEVGRGELIAVLGKSGSGKTTLLRLLCGLERADAGSIVLGDRMVARGPALHVPPEKRGVGYVAQEGALFPHMSVAQNVLFGLPRSLLRSRRAERDARVGQLLDLMGLPGHYAQRMPAELSGGEQQRVAVARALAPGPAVVLLDEPFSALDAGLRAETRTAVVASLKHVGATGVLVTHDQDEALSLADRVAVLQGGRLAQVAAPQSLYRDPLNPAVAAFVGEAVLIPGTLVDGLVDCCFGRLPAAAASRNRLQPDIRAVDVMIRPEQIQLHLDGVTAGSGGTPKHTARVERLNFYGHDARVALRLDCGPRFTSSVSGCDLPTEGDVVHVRVAGPVVVYPRGT